MSVPPPNGGVSPQNVEKAVKALLKWRSNKSKTEKPQLLEQDEFVYLILTLKKIPQKGADRTNAHKIPLPNPLINPENGNPELCLIIDDRPKSGLTKDAARKKIQSDNIPISKIIKLSKLKTDYRPFEAKRKLCDSYDMFFADRGVIPLLPKLLGKHFFKKKKIPVAVNLKHKNWKEQIDKVCRSALLFLGTGTCSVVKVGRLSMEKEEIVENAVAAINGIAEIVPKKSGGIRSFHLKLLESLALPVYQALPDFKLKIENGEEEEKVEKEMPKQVKVGKKKGRIHEVRYMDNNVKMGDVSDEDKLGSDGENGTDEDDDDNAKIDHRKLEVKKRKMEDKVEDDKKVKKDSKVKEEGGFKKENARNELGVEQRKQKKDGLAFENDEIRVKDKKKKK